MRIATLTFAVGLLLTGCGKKEEASTAPPPPAPPTVIVAEARQVELPVFKDTIATLEGSAGTEIKAEVTGYVVKQAFEEGSTVKAGDLLFLVNAKPFQGDAKTTNSSEKPETEKDYVRITSPVDGVAGRAAPGLGDLVKPGMTLTIISTVDPIMANFAFIETSNQNAAQGFSYLMSLPPEARREDIELHLADGTPYPHKGNILSAAPLPTPPIIKATGVLALFPNPDRVLRPGQLVKLSGLTKQDFGAVTVPRQAINELQGIDRVMVVKPDDTVEIRTVTLGDRSPGPTLVVTSGLKTGERVIVGGSQTYEAGTLVTPQAAIASQPGEH
jgi:membrane fusion protein (multidrug efflux system)